MGASEVGREQVMDLLRALNGFYDLPRPGLDLTQTLVANAQRAQSEAQRRFGVSLLPNELGVSALSQLLSSMHEAVRPSRFASILGFKISFRSSVLIANTFGAFLGEALRQRLGGEWRVVDFQNQKLVALWFDEKSWSLPTYKAGKHFTNGAEDDVMFFYQVFVEKRLFGGLKDAFVITQADSAKGREHVMNLYAAHEQKQRDKAKGKMKE